MPTEADRKMEIERIQAQAVCSVLMRCAQLFDGLRQSLNSEKRQLGFTQRFSIPAELERECAGIVETIKAAVADDLPLDPRNAVEIEDHFDLLDDEAIAEIGMKVRKTVRELLGVFD